MNMAYEVYESVLTNYADGDDEQTLIDTFMYLYQQSTDKELKRYIEDWFEVNDICIDCGIKLKEVEYYETHWELEGNPREYFTEKICPNCGF